LPNLPSSGAEVILKRLQIPWDNEAEVEALYEDCTSIVAKGGMQKFKRDGRKGWDAVTHQLNK